jgi:hypothetical protein
MVSTIFLIIYGIIGLNSLLILFGLFKTIFGIQIIKRRLTISEIKKDYKTIEWSGYLLFLAVFLQIFLLFISALSRTELVSSPLKIWEIFIFINFYSLIVVYLFNYLVGIVSYIRIKKNNLSNSLSLISLIIRGLPLILLVILILDRTVVNIL